MNTQEAGRDSSAVSLGPERIEWYLGDEDDSCEDVFLYRLECALRGSRNYEREFAAICATTVRRIDSLSQAGKVKLIGLMSWYIRTRRPSEADHMLADGIVMEYQSDLALALALVVLEGRWHSRIERLAQHLEFLRPDREDVSERRRVWEAIIVHIDRLWPRSSSRRRRVLNSLKTVLANTMG